VHASILARVTGLIAVSVGNTRTQIGRFEDGALTASEHVVNADVETVSARIALHWDAIEGAEERAIAMASVNDSFAHPLESDVETRTGATVERIGRDLAVPIGTQLDEGTRTGLDRLLCAAAAYARVRQACIVIDAGTAVTVDFVDGVGTFQGGAIAPGMRAQFAALHTSTDALPQVAPEEPEPEAFGKNTVEAMRQGVYWGIRGLVQKLVERYSEAFGAFPMVIATGGDAELLFSNDELVNHVVPDLALYGIAAAFEADSGHAHDRAER
jgi:type III pantothenate kinase